MKANRIMMTLAILTLALSVVAGGCGPTATPAPEPTKAEAPTAPTEAAPAEEEITITFWHIYGPEMAGANSWFKDMIAAFEEEHPNIHIEEEITPNDPYKVKLKTAIAAGEAADAFMVYPGGWTEPYAKDGAILPVDKYLDEGGWRDNYIASAFDELTWDGKTYGFPLALRTVHIWYNKEVFDKYGLEPPETMAELKEIIKTLRDNGVTPFALGNKERWQGNFWASYLFARVGGYEAWHNAVTRQGQGWADPSHVEALTLLQELVKMGAFTEGTNGVGAMDVNNSFFTGEAAMILNGTFFVDQVKSLAPEGFLENNLGYFNFPVIEGGKGSVKDYHGGVGSAFVINSKSEHPDEVAAFYRFMFTPEHLKELSRRTSWVMTVKDTVPDDASPLLLSLAKEAEQMEHLIWYADHAMVPAVYEVYADATQAVFGLSITPEEAVAKMEEAATKELGPPSGAGEAAAPAAPAEEEITITFWHIYGPEMAGANSWFKDMIAAFEEEHPNIHIEEEITPNDPYKVKLKTAIAAGEAADAFMVYSGGWAEPYAKEGAILPLDKYLDEDGWRDQWISGGLDQMTWDGKTYGVTTVLRTVHIWYNKEVFDKYGLEPPETMAELKEIIKTLRDNGVTPFALGNKERWPGNFYASYLFARVGGYEAWHNAVTRQGQGWADPSHVEALTLLQELVKMGAFTEGTNGIGAMDVNNSFFTGEAAMIMHGTYFVDIVKSLAPEGFLENNLGYFNFPVIEGGKGSARDYHGGTMGTFVINSKSEHPDEVAAFYRFMFTPEHLKELSRRTNWVMTVKDTVPDDASPLLLSLAKEAEQMEHLIWYADSAMVPAVYEVYADATQAVFGLSITPEEAVAKMEEAARKEYGK